jgi:hypothetical protein
MTKAPCAFSSRGLALCLTAFAAITSSASRAPTAGSDTRASTRFGVFPHSRAARRSDTERIVSLQMRALRIAGSWLAASALVIACAPKAGGGDADSGGNPGAPDVRDTFYRTVVAGRGTQGSVSGTANIVLFEPKLASQRAPGSPGSNPSSHDAGGVLYLGSSTTALKGSYDTSGSYSVAGGGYTLTGEAQGTTTSGTFTGPGGASGSFSGADIWQGGVQAYCGSYSGSASGTWNFVVDGTGGLHGTFAGNASGSLSGQATSSSVSITWSASSASGTATGAISGSSVQGSWQGSGGLQGSWQSDSSRCPGSAPTVSSSSGCVCGNLLSQTTLSACCPSGACCTE